MVFRRQSVSLAIVVKAPAVEIAQSASACGNQKFPTLSSSTHSMESCGKPFNRV